MSIRTLPFDFVEKQIRKKKFCFIGSVDSNGNPHSAGVMYSVSPTLKKFRMYIMTGATVRKTRNIKQNHRVSISIPYSHHLMRFAPDFCIQFQGTAEIVPFSDDGAQEAFRSNMLMKMMLEKISSNPEEHVAFCIKPDEKIHGFGLGRNLFHHLKDIGASRFVSFVPQSRR